MGGPYGHRAEPGGKPESLVCPGQRCKPQSQPAGESRVVTALLSPRSGYSGSRGPGSGEQARTELSLIWPFACFSCQEELASFQSRLLGRELGRGRELGCPAAGEAPRVTLPSGLCFHFRCPASPPPAPARLDRKCQRSESAWGEFPGSSPATEPTPENTACSHQASQGQTLSGMGPAAHPARRPPGCHQGCGGGAWWGGNASASWG